MKKQGEVRVPPVEEEKRKQTDRNAPPVIQTSTNTGAPISLSYHCRNSQIPMLCLPPNLATRIQVCAWLTSSSLIDDQYLLIFVLSDLDLTSFEQQQRLPRLMQMRRLQRGIGSAGLRFNCFRRLLCPLGGVDLARSNNTRQKEPVGSHSFSRSSDPRARLSMSYCRNVAVFLVKHYRYVGIRQRSADFSWAT